MEIDVHHALDLRAEFLGHSRDEQLVAGEVSEPMVADLEARNNIFPDLDYRIYAT